MKPLADALFQASEAIRYVALYRDGRLELHERSGLRAASSAESDRYEELLVNPTLIVLARQRGEIDCGGLEYVLIRYGNFFQLVHPVNNGHVSVAIEPEADPLEVVAILRDHARSRGLLP
jgi:hypothetical protein